MTTHRICSKCKVEKTREEFYLKKDDIAGIQGHCIECVIEANKIRSANKTKGSYNNLW